ncbi:Zinc-finger domain of monoamine-oxidase A repressor R1 [Popillia japonica]|uniref:Zinc-finger domain of monoamine-oxidase A repressor R1 n=1 Tax=Popillia japonica TaxID=7064 RepID=A0AAW1L6R0_POPJA
MDFDMSGDEEISELERLRQKNMKEFEAMMSEFAKDINESIIILNDYGKLQNNKRKKKAPPKELFERRRSDRLLNKPKRRALPEELFGRRRSDRLLNITPRFSFKDLEDDERKRRKRLCLKNSRVPPFVAVEDITDTYLESKRGREERDCV